MSDLLPIALSAAVPLWIISIQRGEVNLPDFHATAVLIGEHGDAILYNTKKRGKAAEVFNELAKVVAFMSFCPGGVTIFGQHYESEGLPDFLWKEWEGIKALKQLSIFGGNK